MTVRSASNPELFSSMSLWVRKNLRGSSRKPGEGLAVTDLDFVFDDFEHRKFMLVEVKEFMAPMNFGQKWTLRLLDDCLRHSAPSKGYEYWGFYLVQLLSHDPKDGVYLNHRPITLDQLVAHLNFERKAAESYCFGDFRPRQVM